MCEAVTENQRSAQTRTTRGAKAAIRASASPGPLSIGAQMQRRLATRRIAPHDALALQRATGNRAVSRLVTSAPNVQLKRTTARPDEDNWQFEIRSKAYDECRRKGAELWDQLEKARLPGPQENTGKPTPGDAPLRDYRARYDHTCQVSGDIVTVKTSLRGQKKCLYENDFNIKAGEVNAKQNWRNVDEQEGPTHGGPGGKPLHNSAILWNQRRAAIVAAPPQVSKIGLISRRNITNMTTFNVVNIVHDEPETWTEKASLPPSDDFLALLGTDNARSTAYMLLQHRGSLLPAITKITTKLMGLGTTPLMVDYLSLRLGDPPKTVEDKTIEKDGHRT